MSVKLYEGDKEVKFMTLGEAAKELNTTVVDIKALAKKTYLPIYEIAGGRISSGDLDFIKEKLDGGELTETATYYPTTILADGPPPLARGGLLYIPSNSPINPNLKHKQEKSLRSYA